MPVADTSFLERLQAVERRIENAATRTGRARSAVTLVAVTKKFSSDRIRQAYAAGICNIGENYVQEFAGKYSELTALHSARYHLIGHLQTNKARIAADLFSVVETVDSVKLLPRLDEAARELGKRLEILLEVKTSHEGSKTGAAEEEIPALVDAARRCRNLELTGLMTVPPWSDDPEASRPYFRQLRSLAEQHKLPQLSMGMSNDLEVAIEEGATMIRIGTALFGPRPKPSPKIEQQTA